MVVRAISDTHLEYHMDGGVGFTKSLDPAGVDVLILAGDIGNFGGRRQNNLMAGLHVMCQKFPHVVYVRGNHEFYGVHRDPLRQAFRDFVADGHPNFYLLDNSTITIQGQRFIGATMWFLDSPRTVTLRAGWSDFINIPQFGRWWLREAQNTQAFLKKEMRSTDVVVTHYCPSWSSEDPRYRGSSSAEFFIVNMEPLILRVQPRLWVHGHTHRSFDYKIDRTRVVCNPLGYPHALNSEFDPNLHLSL